MTEESDTTNKRGGFIAKGWRSVREAGTVQLVSTVLLVLLALFIARYSWVLPGGEEPTPITNDAERALYDTRAYLSADLVEQDERIILVVFNDQALINLEKRSPLPRGAIAEALRNLDGMGAKAIGIDILFDQPQAEDIDLIETLRGMETPTSVAYATVATNEADIAFEQQLFLDDFMAAIEEGGTNARRASIRLDDEFGATRVWPDIVPTLPPLLGRAMLEDAGGPYEAFEGYEGAIEYRRPLRADFEGGEGEVAADSVVEEPLFQSLSIELFLDMDPAVAEFVAQQIEGKYVLIGGDILDYDRVVTSLYAWTGFEPAGLSVHGELIAQMLDGKRLAQVPVWALWVMAILVVSTAVLTALLEWPAKKLVPLLFGLAALFIGIPFVLHFQNIDTYGLPAVGWLVAWIVAFTAVTAAARSAGAAQRSFAQGALGKYIPKDIAQQIIDEPELLSLGGEKREIFVLFSDLEGFTKMSHAIQPEMVAKLLNRYLEMLSNVVLQHGGVIDKYVGDAVVAFWGAPIARPDDAQRALEAGYAMWKAGEDFRAEVAAMDPNLPKIGKTRVGLHFGEAVVGNFGGDMRIQYTALGDSMNTAARLEAANKPLNSNVSASREFIEKSNPDWWVPMGRIVLRGRAQPVDIYHPKPGFPEEDRRKLEEAVQVSDTDPELAAKLVDEVLAGHPDDLALQNYSNRIRNLNDGGAYVLG
ncbi:adenylate/guanylate cyclase catalytic domain protein [Erythrobacter sp. NAP1]|uniref:adenylate/guanylate cyclase domain-containing protein n=1 Tax=Erythrobacter sp. NAP1 TaxID=237727 RepID=UPI00006851D9|nr:adenylate/guanylate cyclase domain-containing protein [Erythrobacter sp. NAP1]EAQ27650.1 adenylate/guanylate cyclase catalytic domain protein [Erythrobacter sp. NAP1]